jgi:hypothetical protein
MILLGIIGAQDQRVWLERELQRTQLRIQKVERIIVLIHNDKLRMEWEIVKTDFERARQLFFQQKYQLSQLQLKAVNAKINLILKAISEHPLFRKKFIRDLEFLLTRAERKIQNSGNQIAIYYLKEAYNLKERGEFILKNRPDAFYQGIELLYIAKNLAAKAIRLVNLGREDAIDEMDLQLYLQNLRRKFERLKARNLMPEVELQKIEKLYHDAQLSYESGNKKIALKKLMQIDQILDGIHLPETSLNRLLNQLYKQKKELEILKQEKTDDEIVLKMIDRIDNNLLKIEKAVDHDQFIIAKKLLSINFQLFRTIRTMMNGPQREGKVLQRQFERFRNEVAAIRAENPENSSFLHLLNRLERRIQNAMDSGKKIRAARLLKRAFKILQTYYQQDKNAFFSKKLIFNFIRKVEKKINELPQEDQKVVQNLLAEIQAALDQNDIEKAKQLAIMLQKYLED